MEELKPRLILTKSNKSGFDVGKYIFFLTIFIVGFYFGYSYKSLDSDIVSDGKNKISKATEKRFKKLDPERSVKPQVVSPVLEENKDIEEDKTDYETSAKEQTVLAEKPDENKIEDNAPKPGIKDAVSKPNVENSLTIVAKDVQPSKDDKGLASNSNNNLQDIGNVDETSSEDGMSYTLQIAAFETERKSNQVVEELSSKGYKVYSISVVNSEGDRWNLVRLGNFASLNEAQEFSELLLTSEGINANIKTIEKSKVKSSSKYY